MKLLQPLSEEHVDKKEKDLLEYWDDIDLLQLSLDERKDAEDFIFYEGPPTANGKPGIHHVMARTLKDLVCRYKTMSGYRVNRKAGWDTHGLPVEIQVEKELGLEDKKDIVEYGIENFNNKCKESVFTYEKEWRELTVRMGYLIDLDDPYITMENEYIESVWWILDQMFKDGLIYEGHKILPYCGRCGTGLASHEVAQGYQEITTTSVYVKFKIQDKDEHFLAWTTTPWTLPSNVVLAVNPDITYVKARVEGEEDPLILAKDLVEDVFEQRPYEILEEMKGSDLAGIKYEQLMPFIETDKDAFFVVEADYVSTESGTGIVHSAPAFGEEDYQTGQKYNLPVFNPVDDTGSFTDTPWKGMFVIDADPQIIDYLYDNDLLFRRQKIDHNYPHCWRCDTELIYHAKPSWYIEVTKYKDQLISENNDVNWFPDHVGQKRFGNWLEELKDWAISRSRFWGTPLPIWRCENNHFKSIGSIEELRREAIEDVPADIELHRPYVDDIHLKCPECGEIMTREEDVIDVWFDSGAMPFAQWHYPFENKDNHHNLYPADFINEGIDQTRGWFYSLLAIGTYVTGKAPYKNVLVNDLILDKDGKKMSKSRGNTVDPNLMFEKYGADVLRWYLMSVSAPWVPTRFDESDIPEVQSKFFRTIRNIYNLLSLYANTDDIDIQSFHIDEKDRPEIDRWLLSRFNNLVKVVKEDMDKYEINKVVRDIQEFVNEDFSNWYIRRNRRRFWKTDQDNDKKSVYNTTYEVLLGTIKLIAPIVPFMSEEIYQKMTGKKTVHIEMYPQVNEELIDPQLEEKMEIVRSLVFLGRVSREKEQIKVRQPLSHIIVDAKYQDLIGDLADLIKEELNVKEVRFEDDLQDYMDFDLKVNFKNAGSVLGPKVQDLAKYLTNLENPNDFINELEENGSVKIKLAGEDHDISEDFVLVHVNSKEGFDVSSEKGLFLILDTDLTDELIDEGYVREVISRIQNIRRDEDLEVLDRIRISINAKDQIKDALNKDISHIQDEVLADEINFVDTKLQTYDINGFETGIEIEKI